MFNFKICGIVAGVACILSLIIGLISGSGFLVLLFRALILGILFFVISCLISWLQIQFLPELFNPEEDTLGLSSPGSRVNISVGNGPVVGAFPADNSEMVDDIDGVSSAAEKLSPEPLDQMENAGYNQPNKIGDDLEFGNSRAARGMNSDRKADSADTLPDMSDLGEGVLGDVSDMVGANAINADSYEPRRPKSYSKKSEIKGDFNPKELAQAIQTVLKREEKG